MKSNFPVIPEPCVNACVCVRARGHAPACVFLKKNASGTNVGKSWHTLINKAT